MVRPLRDRDIATTGDGQYQRLLHAEAAGFGALLSAGEDFLRTISPGRGINHGLAVRGEARTVNTAAAERELMNFRHGGGRAAMGGVAGEESERNQKHAERRGK